MRVPPFLAATVFVAIPLLAQQKLPPSYLESLAAQDHLEDLTAKDFTELTSKAQSGEPQAEYLLALVYCCGPMPRDEATARRWMLKSAEQAYVPAQAWMGKMYLPNQMRGPGPYYWDADRWLRLAAAQGDAEAQFWLGVGYERGYFGGIDYEESLRWLRKAAAQELPDAQFCLGQMYEEGEVLPESNERAAYWFKKAADHFSDIHGVFSAEVQLAYMYHDERLKGNDIDAYMWFAVVDSSVDPPVEPATDDNIRRVASRMTDLEIVEAQQRAKDWIKRHPRLHRLPADPNP
jgi:TPR repeat protein